MAFFCFAAVLFFFAGDGVGETLAVAAPVVEVAVVPCCVQEIINAAPIRTVMNVKTDLFIITVQFEVAESSVRPLNGKHKRTLLRRESPIGAITLAKNRHLPYFEAHQPASGTSRFGFRAHNGIATEY